MANISVNCPRLAWSLKEISGATKLSVPFLRLEISRKALKAVRCGRRVLVNDEELRRYLSEGSLKSPSKRESVPTSGGLPWEI